MEAFESTHMQKLADQLLRGPRRLRFKQLLSIEFLLSIIETEREYPYDFVLHALTGYRPKGDKANGSAIAGKLLMRDLIILAEKLSENADFPLQDWLEPVHTVNELAERFDVSTKTVFRWRRRGLAGWKFRFDDRRMRLAFPERCVRRFVSQHADLVCRGSNFSQLSKSERERIVERAKQLVTEGHKTVNAVARVISDELGRAVETVRLILKHYDDAHPKAGIFNRSAFELEADDHRLAIWEAYVDGNNVRQLSERFGKPIPAVYKVITEMRARALRAETIEYVPSEEFTLADADEVILPKPEVALRQPLSNKNRVPSGLPPYLAQLFRIPLLTKEGEQYLFRKMNYLKFKADELRKQIDPETTRARQIDTIEDLLEEAAAVKNEIVQANLRLVVGIAKRHVSPTNDLFELISDGNVSLMRAVDKFDYMRGFKFSTYASWAIIKNFARSVPEHHQHRERYQTGWDEMLGTAIPVHADEADNEQLDAVRVKVEQMLAQLDDRERKILQQRYGLEGRGQAQTLEQIGQRFGVSKERIRQLEARALSRLRVEFKHDAQQILNA